MKVRKKQWRCVGKDPLCRKTLEMLDGEQGGLGGWNEVSRQDCCRKLSQKDSRMRWEDTRAPYGAYFSVRLEVTGCNDRLISLCHSRYCFGEQTVWGQRWKQEGQLGGY